MDKKSDVAQQSPFLPYFEVFRNELDEHHDRRERIVKASRDITAASKKIIFALQRVRTLGKPLSAGTLKAFKSHINTVAETFTAVSPDLQGINFHRYERNISGGIQEYIEALSFQHYLETQQLLTHEAAQGRLQSFAAEGQGLTCTYSDYLLGIFDMTGELMRFAITGMAEVGALPRASSRKEDGAEPQRSVLNDLQEIRARLETLDSDIWGYNKKLEVTQASVQKVERALYGLKVRGSERPKGWMPDLTEARDNEAEAFSV
ncbi:MAG: hypothetical protein Q9159_005146 [Coniocarpon cinnabarinum]